MAIDVLQDKIRKLKNPSMIDFGVLEEYVPPFLLEEEGAFLKAYGRFCASLMNELKEVVPAIRFSFSTFALYGAEGLMLLQGLTNQAKEYGFYVVLDAPQVLSSWEADRAARLLETASYPCDALVVSAYIGTDGIKPFVPVCKKTGKDLYVIVRSPNKSAAEIQDLLTGSRHVHIAAADLVSRHGTETIGKCGYSQIAGVSASASSNSLQQLRTKYKNLFLLVDGYEVPAVNAKNCALAFDRLGHGAAVCAGAYITGAWQAELSDGLDYVACAQRAAEKMKFNLSRYVTIL